MTSTPSDLAFISSSKPWATEGMPPLQHEWMAALYVTREGFTLSSAILPRRERPSSQRPSFAQALITLVYRMRSGFSLNARASSTSARALSHSPLRAKTLAIDPNVRASGLTPEPTIVSNSPLARSILLHRIMIVIMSLNVREDVRRPHRLEELQRADPCLQSLRLAALAGVQAAGPLARPHS
eukprot:CAMPEP_0114538402 /NCGR_PEP_ID=MMETSP0109-20121206/30121_1 /TAXON_ID=29199 /ORGANISM="Chlorarachnion reptans, Strain CCCM449" /LENGTH=182 /DNA_ID=CAMNT_0001722413 /DNA_START=24 /DNA_END=569 /DNA_ORIENTATION=+